MSVYVLHNIWIWIHWRMFLRSSYRELVAWVGFEPSTTEFRLDALTDWAIRLSFQMAVRANFAQLLQFYLFVQCSHLILVIAFVSRHICFKWNLIQVITLVAKWNDIYRLFTTEVCFLEVAVESWPEWDLKPRPLNFLFIRSNQLSYQAMNLTCTQSQLCTVICLFHVWFQQLPLSVATFALSGMNWYIRYSPLKSVF